MFSLKKMQLVGLWIETVWRLRPSCLRNSVWGTCGRRSKMTQPWLQRGHTGTMRREKIATKRERNHINQTKEATNAERQTLVQLQEWDLSRGESLNVNQPISSCPELWKMSKQWGPDIVRSLSSHMNNAAGDSPVGFFHNWLIFRTFRFLFLVCVFYDPSFSSCTLHTCSFFAFSV